MKLLIELLQGLDFDSVIGDTDATISLIQYNSTQISSGDLFVAISGAACDGHDFISDAILAGSAAIVCERLPDKLIKNITYVKVKNSAFALSILSSSLYLTSCKCFCSNTY